MILGRGGGRGYWEKELRGTLQETKFERHFPGEKNVDALFRKKRPFSRKIIFWEASPRGKNYTEGVPGKKINLKNFLCPQVIDGRPLRFRTSNSGAVFGHPNFNEKKEWKSQLYMSINYLYPDSETNSSASRHNVYNTSPCMLIMRLILILITFSGSSSASFLGYIFRSTYMANFNGLYHTFSNIIL